MAGKPSVSMMSLHSTVELLTHRVKSVEEDQVNICDQLKHYDAKMSQSVADINAKLANLQSAYDRQEGAKSVIKWVQLLVVLAVGILQIISMVRR